MGKINYIKIDNPRQAAGFAAGRLSAELQAGASVLWLVPGGSALEVAVLAAQQIDKQALGADLTVSLTDERFGRPGHKDSNWRQLEEKGFFIKGARMLPVLQGLSLEDEAVRYDELLEREIASTDYSLALAGLGEDGHIFGIKPGSPAVSSTKDAVGYGWDDFTRLTPTVALLRKIDEIILYVVGPAKHHQLRMLESELDPAVQPAQLLKRLNGVTILNDWKGEEI